MKKTLALLSALFVLLSFHTITAQTAESIVESYLETIGGKKNLEGLKSIKFTCKANAQGMEIPVTMYQKAPNKQRMDMSFQGQEITQMAFDGETGWSTNFMTMKPEKWDAEQSEIMKSEMTFPDVFLNYKDKGYTVSLDGEEEVEGTMCHKLKLTKKPITVDGKEEENFAYYFIDKETNVIIMQRDFAKVGEMKGQATETFFSDYDEVEGVYFPFTIAQKLNGQQVFSLSVEEAKANIEIEDTKFAFPEEASEENKN